MERFLEIDSIGIFAIYVRFRARNEYLLDGQGRTEEVLP